MKKLLLSGDISSKSSRKRLTSSVVSFRELIDYDAAKFSDDTTLGSLKTFKRILADHIDFSTIDTTVEGMGESALYEFHIKTSANDIIDVLESNGIKVSESSDETYFTIKGETYYFSDDVIWVEVDYDEEYSDEDEYEDRW